MGWGAPWSIWHRESTGWRCNRLVLLEESRLCQQRWVEGKQRQEHSLVPQLCHRTQVTLNKLLPLQVGKGLCCLGHRVTALPLSLLGWK